MAYMISARALGELDIPARGYIIDPFLPERGLAMIWAERGIGKTWVALCMALAIARGEDFLTYEVTAPSCVFYIDGEMPLAELKQRLKALCPDLPENLFILSSETLALQGLHLNINNADHRGRLEKTLAEMAEDGNDRQVIILDNLSSLSSGSDENSNSEQDEILQWLIRLRHAGYTVVLVHHAGKSGQQRGASRREDILDTSIKLEVPKDEEGIDRSGGATFILSFTKTRGKTPVPDKLVLSLRENGNGRLELQFQKSVIVAPYLQTLRTIAAGVVSPSGLRPYRTQNELAEHRKLTKAAISKHMTKLRNLKMAVDAPNGIAVTPGGVKQVGESFGVEVPASLRWDPDSQDEIPF